MHDAAPILTKAHKHARRLFSISGAQRRQINDERKLPRRGHAIAVNQMPGHGRRYLVVVRLPRGTAGKPPRHGVQIPAAPDVAAAQGRESKHRRQQVQDGKSGSKGRATIARKAEFVASSQRQANALAAVRRLQRQEGQ